MPDYEEATVQYLTWSPLYDYEKPFQLFLDLPDEAEDQRKTNLTWEEKVISVQDLRVQLGSFTLDEHGFVSRKLEGFIDLRDQDRIEKDYIPAVKTLLEREIEDVGTVFVFDWRLRDSRADHHRGVVDFSDKEEKLLPSNYVHMDVAPISVIQRIQKSFPNQAQDIFKQRIRAVNIWKPLFHPVDEWALAVCDGSSVDPSDLVETDSVRQGSISSVYYAKYSKDHKWYFVSHQMPDEALIFKHFDSKRDVNAPYALHASIKHMTVSPDAKPRKSIEIRTLIFSQAFDIPEEKLGTESSADQVGGT